jgi:methyl-accepting chemotaxis protein
VNATTLPRGLTPAETSRLLNSILSRGFLVSVVPALAGAYLVALLVDAPTDWRAVTVISVVLGVFGLVLPNVVSGSLLRSALGRPEGDLPGARLERLLTLPRRIELYSGNLAWGGGALAYSASIAIIYDKPFWVVPAGTVVGLLLSMLLGIPTSIINRRLLENLVIDEFHAMPGAARIGTNALFPRKAWYLPYTFAVMMFATLGFVGTVVAVKGSNLIAESTRRFEAAGQFELASEFRGLVDAFLPQVLVPGALMALVLLGVFVMAGWLFAIEETNAAIALRVSLASIAAGTPRLPRTLTPDEMGDIAVLAAQVANDLDALFGRLRDVARGDLSVQLTGESTLAKEFQVFQLALLSMIEQMSMMARGDIVQRATVVGDLGVAFDTLTDTISAVILQASTISEGDLRKDVDAAGALGVALERMTHRLRSLVGEMQGQGGRLSSIVVSLRSTATQLSTAATHQVAAISETANTMAEMSQTSAVSADRASDLIKKGESASTVVEDGRRDARRAVDAMNLIQASLQRVAAASTELSERFQRIDSIIETVGFLADQSSTLAINAGIEASRAGEAGRGFAAVAREMRTLASDSRKATTQIREILSELRQKTVSVDAQVGEGARTVSSGSEQVNRLGGIVEVLGTTIHEAVLLMRQVEGSARQHQAGVTQVSQALSSMQTSSQSIRDGARMLTELSETAHAMSQALQTITGSYKLPASTAPAP